MYNLLMANSEDFWDSSPAVLTADRVFEYTEKSLQVKYKNNDGKILESVLELPCLFCYEFVNKLEARIGKIEKVEYLNKEIKIYFTIDTKLPAIPFEALQSLEWELQMEKFEKYRTHWAIKTVDLYQVLEQKLLIPIRSDDTEIKKISDILSGVSLLKSEPSSVEKPINVFISYCHRDFEYLERLKVHFKSVNKKIVFDLWDDTRIDAGDVWKEEIRLALQECSVAVLLISADSLTSDFIMNTELPAILQKAHGSGTRIIPVILKPCAFETHIELSAFQAINAPSSPLIGMNELNREKIYLKIVETVLS